MRRVFTGTAAAVLLLTVAAACAGTPPAGTDGDLADDWAAMPAPTPFRPAAGECHEALAESVSMAEHRPVSCDDLHVAETFHVGEAADGPVAPVAGSAPVRTAYAECADRATAFLGGPPRGSRVVLRAVFPSREGWDAGARWFRCDASTADLDGTGDTTRKGSLAGTLAGDSELRLGCFDAAVTKGTVRTMTAVDCRRPHAAEYAGEWTAPDVPYADQIADRTRSAAGCRRAIARFTGVPADSELQFRVGWISYNPARSEWLQGERRVRCFLWFSDRKVSRSLAGAGPSALPVS